MVKMIDGRELRPGEYESFNNVYRVDDPKLVNEFDPNKDPFWYILRKAEISFEQTRRVSAKNSRKE